MLSCDLLVLVLGGKLSPVRVTTLDELGVAVKFRVTSDVGADFGRK